MHVSLFYLSAMVRLQCAYVLVTIVISTHEPILSFEVT